MDEIKELKEAEALKELKEKELFDPRDLLDGLAKSWPYVALGVLGTLALLNIDQIWHFWWLIFFVKPLFFGWFGWHPFGKGCMGKSKYPKYHGKGEYV